MVKFSKGHNSVKMLVQLKFLFSAHPLMMLYIYVFVQPQKQTWIKEAHEKNAKMQDICNKETKTTAASLTEGGHNII